MAVELRFGADDLTRCRFAVSPLCETHQAVATLHRTHRDLPHQHPPAEFGCRGGAGVPVPGWAGVVADAGPRSCPG
jgi:hypothetical protein